MSSISQNQIIELLMEQNRMLKETIEEMKANKTSPILPEISEAPKRRVYKKKITEVSEEIVLEKPKKMNISPEGHASHIATGKRVAGINAIRKEFLQNAKLEGEW